MGEEKKPDGADNQTTPPATDPGKAALSADQVRALISQERQAITEEMKNLFNQLKAEIGQQKPKGGGKEGEKPEDLDDKDGIDKKLETIRSEFQKRESAREAEVLKLKAEREREILQNEIKDALGAAKVNPKIIPFILPGLEARAMRDSTGALILKGQDGKPKTDKNYLHIPFAKYIAEEFAGEFKELVMADVKGGAGSETQTPKSTQAVGDALKALQSQYSEGKITLREYNEKAEPLRAQLRAA